MKRKIVNETQIQFSNSQNRKVEVAKEENENRKLNSDPILRTIEKKSEG